MTFVHGSSSTAAQRFLNHLTAIPLSHLSDVYFLCANRDRLAPSTLATFLQPNRATLVDLRLSEFPLTVSGLKELGSFPGVINLKVGQEGAATELHEFFGMIAFSFPNLRLIDVTLDEAITEDVSVAGIGGLAACRELRILFLTSRNWKSLTAEDLGRFGSWWPSMESFSLSQPYDYQDQVRIPLGILQDFARVWSQTLNGLRLEFDVEAPLPSLSSVKLNFEKLGVLDVGGSDILESSVDGVAAFLKKLSPGRLVISSDSNCARWHAVMSKVNAQFVAQEDVILP
ncbi:hypothetical protein M407DRAFT_19388 [Tulasnella calospora MUT 4182]|uniref:F-box domain-containing protein n=1 Tax=Tulasnella calospora MUT 4182 TaxID=1051891 RepID=A0A0C3QTP7_9AGAM|nr:hypothetical protein M407DRAFT_19388 [Tulasnella calospora MUT 4182]